MAFSIVVSVAAADEIVLAGEDDDQEADGEEGEDDDDEEAGDQEPLAAGTPLSASAAALTQRPRHQKGRRRCQGNRCPHVCCLVDRTLY